MTVRFPLVMDMLISDIEPPVSDHVIRPLRTHCSACRPLTYPPPREAELRALAGSAAGELVGDG